LNIPLSEERLREITPALSETMKLILPLSKLDLPKEVETTTYLAYLSAIEERKRPDTK
jgi:hypothetical protein